MSSQGTQCGIGRLERKYFKVKLQYFNHDSQVLMLIEIKEGTACLKEEVMKTIENTFSSDLVLLPDDGSTCSVVVSIPENEGISSWITNKLDSAEEDLEARLRITSNLD